MHIHPDQVSGGHCHSHQHAHTHEHTHDGVTHTHEHCHAHDHEHTHPHEQVCYVAEGSFEFEADGKKTIISKGDSYYVEPNAPHGVVALEKGVLIDIFTPQREDFLK